MNKAIITFATVAFACNSIFASDLTKCNNQYLISAKGESQTQVSQSLSAAMLADFLAVKTYEPIGQLTIYSIEAMSYMPENMIKTYKLMLDLQKLPDTVVECNSPLSL